MTGVQTCALPIYRTDDGQWQRVTGASDYTIRKRDPVRVTFKPVTTRALRLEIELTKDFSAGIYEWEVE